MEKAEIIKDNFQKAAKGIDNDLVKDKDKWYNLVLNMPKHLQVVYTIIIFQHEVFNGGFHQYFFNASGQFAYLTMENLKLIKAFKTFEILEKALKEVNSGGYNLDEFRNKIFYRKLEGITQFDENLFNFLNDLDSEYYELEGKEDIEQLLIGYLKSHQG